MGRKRVVAYVRVSSSSKAQLHSYEFQEQYAQKELFTRYADCVREYQVMAECLLFQNSFRLGGRMMLEVMRGIG